MISYRELSRQDVEDYAKRHDLNIETEENYREVAQELFNLIHGLPEVPLTQDSCDEICTINKMGLLERAIERGLKPMHKLIIETYLALLSTEQEELLGDIYVHDNSAGAFVYWRIVVDAYRPWRTIINGIKYQATDEAALIKIIDTVSHI